MYLSLLPVAATLFLMVACDFLFTALGPPQGTFSLLGYLYALVPATLFWSGFAVLRSALPRPGQIAVAALVGFLFGALIQVQTLVYFGLGEYMATWMIRFLNDEAGNWASYLHAYVFKPKSFLFALSGLVLFLVWFPWREPRRLQPLVALGTLILCWTGGFFSLYPVHWYLAQAKKPLDTSALYAFGALIGRRPEFDSLTAYHRVELPKEKLPPAPLDVLLVIVESWPREGLAFYGGAPGLMPRLESRLQNEKDWLVFDQAFTNGTYTDVSMASLFTSIATDRPNRPLFEAPLMWDFAKQRGMWTGMVSSQRLEYVGLPRFLMTPALDTYIDQSTLGHPLVNDLGMDDLIAVETLERLLRERPENERVLAVFSNNALHTPYQTQSAQWKVPSTGSAKADATRIVDYGVERILQMLEKEQRYASTLVILTSDHGDHLNHPRGLARPVNFHDEIVRIPLVVKIPKAWRGTPQMAALRANTRRNASNLDLLPTVADALELDKPAGLKPHLARFDGLSLLRPLPKGRWIVSTNSNGNKEVGQVGFALIRDNERLVCASNIPCRFFDVAKDPEQKDDLFHRVPPAYLEPWRQRLKASQILQDHVRHLQAHELQ